MTVVVCGSCAFDHIMVFNGRFRDDIMPERVHALNVSFLIGDLNREYGGCAGNIAYNLRLVGVDASPYSAVGDDFQEYARHLERHGVCCEHLKTLDGEKTAGAYIITDLEGNQITAFHAGAMQRSHEIDVCDRAAMGILAPESREGMLLHARQMKDAGTPFVFDPGQGTPMFDGDDLDYFLDAADYVVSNDYEMGLIERKTGLGRERLAQRVRALVTTKGGEGSEIYADGRRFDIPAAPISRAADPTGCGDAYRAGLLYGLLERLDWETTGRMASLMGAIKVEHKGTQNHGFSVASFNERFERAFGRPGPLRDAAASAISG